MSKLSVIIPSVNGLPTIAECLTALGRQQCGFDFEIIVVDRTQDETAEYIREHFPRVKLIKLAEPCGIPEMRAIAMAQASGDFLVITEDHCIAPENWLAEIIKAHESGYSVIGGAVENGSPARLIDWAVFLCEYSGFMPPIAAGETEFITGNNTSYQRSVIEQVDESLKRDYWEYFLQAELKRMDVKFLSVPSLVISHKKEFGFFYFLSQRFHYSRSFAAMRKRKSSVAEQISYLLYTPVLPFHLIWRIARNVKRKKRNRKEFFLSLPLLLIFMGSYALGELAGQLFGSGNSLFKVE
jgi:GT2 family glycosyltransferase